MSYPQQPSTSPGSDPWGTPQSPAYGSPPPTYGSPPQPPPYGDPVPPPAGPPTKSGTNGFAIASLILGLVAPCGGLLSVVFGIVALNQIKKTGQRGRGLAIGGLVATGVWLVAIAVAAVAVIAVISANNDDSGRDTADDTTVIPDDGEEQISTLELVPGDCLNGLSGEEGVGSLPVTPCTEPHEGEVYAAFDLADGSWPGEDAVFSAAQDGCLSHMESDFPDEWADDEVEVSCLYPAEGTWLTGDREVLCVAYYGDGPRTGSVFD